MDKITEQVNNMPFEVFGLCPDYRVTWMENEWIEFYTPYDYSNIKNLGESNFAEFKDPTRVRLHPNEHKVITENGICVTANFAVHHPSKTIFLRVINVCGHDAYCKVSTYG